MNDATDNQQPEPQPYEDEELLYETPEDERVSASDDEQRADARGGFLSSWVVRITLGVVAIVVVLIIIAVVAYNEVRGSRGEPLHIQHYSGLTRVSEQEPAPGRRTETWQGEFEDLTPSRMAEIEAHYSRQMDSCEKQEVYGPSNPDRYEAIVCQKDRSHDQLGFTQLARVVIKPHWPQAQENDQTDQSEAEEWVGVVVEVNHEWEE